MSQKPYVYQWCYPDGTPFYIGLGKGLRYLRMKARNQHTLNVVAKIEGVGGQVIRQKIAEDLDYEEACALEIRLIAQYGRSCEGGILTNMLPGGEIKSLGHIHSEDARKRLSDLAIERYKDPSERKKISDSKMGHEVSEETRSKMSKAKAGKFQNPEHIAKLRASRELNKLRVAQGLPPLRGGKPYVVRS